MFLIGLSAWSVSVFWSVIMSVSSYMKFKCTRRLFSLVLALGFCFGVGYLIELHRFGWDQWLHLECGVVVWIVASVSFNSQDLMATVVRRIARYLDEFKFGRVLP
eukprot:CAMPEP_0194534542 /NCGR_PEP_ID=MMETSP0253-20130528/72781_1 /TAXON_ID=2966 /ORGANISM="Noctiluca scintillans" /LENGTH=104 /DNA_ID=CAMNT_0039380213 /DNA_START=119 /DNA_END=433 /DNA_ORIENTATION=-